MLISVFKRVSLFSTLSDVERSLMHRAAIYNNLLSICTDPQKRMERARYLETASISPLPEFNAATPGIREKTWDSDLFTTYKAISSHTDNALQAGHLFNHWLVKRGLCPLLYQAFSSWYEIKSPSDIVDLAELSTAYLYKLSSLPPQPDSSRYHDWAALAQGAYGDIFLSPDQTRIVKIPSNLAAKAFMNEWEAVVYRATRGTPLQHYMPELLSYDPSTGIMEKPYIEGVSGWSLLEYVSFRETPHAIDQIRDIYYAADDLFAQSGLNIDIHPGNFHYATAEKRWHLIDGGAMPKIGSDYYPRNDFKAYFQKIWLDLHDLMITVPIRSVDISLPDGSTPSIITQPVFIKR